MRIRGRKSRHSRLLAQLDIGDSLPFPSVIAFASLKSVSASLRLLAVGYCIGHILSVNDVLALNT